MDPVTVVIITGFLGGIVVALFMFRMHAPLPGVDPLRKYPITTDVINMARIRVSGIGGFGLMSMALVVAMFVPRIRQHLLISLVLGIAFAVALIMLRRHNAPPDRNLPGANSVLSLDVPEGRHDRDHRDRPASRIQPVTP